MQPIIEQGETAEWWIPSTGSGTARHVASGTVATTVHDGGRSSSSHRYVLITWHNNRGTGRFIMGEFPDELLIIRNGRATMIGRSAAQQQGKHEWSAYVSANR